MSKRDVHRDIQLVVIQGQRNPVLRDRHCLPFQPATPRNSVLSSPPPSTPVLISIDNTNDEPIRDLEVEGPGVTLSQLLVDIESRGITTCRQPLDDDDDDGAVNKQESDYGEEVAQVQGDVQGYLLKMQSKWLMM